MTTIRRRRARRAVQCAHAVGHDVEGVRVEEPRDLPLVLPDLLEGLASLVLYGEQTLHLDHDQRDPVHVHDDVRDTRMPCLALDLELVGDCEGIVAGIEKIDQLKRLLLGLAGDIAAEVAAEELQPSLVVGDVLEFGVNGFRHVI